MDEDHHHSASWDGMAVRTLSDCVNDDALSRHLLLIDDSLVRKVAHHIIGLLLSGVVRVKAY